MFTYIKNSDINPTEKKIINDKMTITEFEKEINDERSN